METMMMIAAGYLGLCFGSFATMLIPRLMFDEAGIVTGRSMCPKCKRTLGFFDLIPVFSWLFSGGKCKKCGKKISIFYPLTELVFALFFMLMTKVFWETPAYYWIMGITFFALVLGFYDARFQVVDRRVSFPAIGLAALWMFFRPGEITDFLIGGAIGAGFYALQWAISKGRWVGAGDIELGLFMGLVLGKELILGGLFLSYIFGSLTAVIMMASGYIKRGGKLPMGVFLMSALLLFMVWGRDMIDWYTDQFIITF